MKPSTSIIVRKNGISPSAFRYPVNKANRTRVNLYFLHNGKTSTGKSVTSIRRAAFEISVTIPKFSPLAVNYTRPGNYY
ncbi:MAG TPA: hypothetical protein VD993_10465 [Chitinophagaceae bacterium]|nr:hypothetical protein [Chitinophagaceae bacterium]